MFMIYPHSNFHMPNYNNSLIIATKQKNIYRFRVSAMLLFYIVAKKTNTIYSCTCLNYIYCVTVTIAL
jgi:hypothetical protein